MNGKGEAEMDKDIQVALRKARQDYLEVRENFNAVIDEKNHEPQPHPRPEGVFRFWAKGALFLYVSSMICGLIHLDALGPLLLALSILFLILAPIRTSVKSGAYKKYLEAVFAKEVQQWQSRLNAKQEALKCSVTQYIETSDNLLPEKYLNPGFEYYGEHPVVAIAQYIEDGRVDSIKEALNLYEADEREARRDSENAAHRASMEQNGARQIQMAEMMLQAQREGDKQKLKSLEEIARNTKDISESTEGIHDILNTKL